MSALNLPKMYSPVNIKFSSLRNCLGENLGVIFDNDTIIERKAMRVMKAGGGWKWQIKDFHKKSEWNYNIEIDQSVLDEISDDLDCIEFV